MILQNLSNLQTSSRYWTMYRVAKQASRQVCDINFERYGIMVIGCDDDGDDDVIGRNRGDKDGYARLMVMVMMMVMMMLLVGIEVIKMDMLH